MKKMIAVFAAFSLVLSLMSGCGSSSPITSGPQATTAPTTAQTEAPPPVQTSLHSAAESFAGGTGTEADPFQISEPGHLVLLHEMLIREDSEQSFDETYSGGFYILTADIALNDTADFENWSTDAPEYGWQPIGEGLSLHSFAGTLDGDGHRITGLFIDGREDGANYGLFAELRGTVKNLTVEQSFIRADGSMTNVGTIAGDTFDAVIENCTADTVMEVYSIYEAGGIVGSGTTVNGCTFSGRITQTGDSFIHLGGIAGSADLINNCTFSGALSGMGYSGGIVGNGKIVTNCASRGTVTGDTAGGIVGNLYAAGTDLEIDTPHLGLDNCVNSGSVIGTKLAGGIIGSMGNDESDISMSVINCVNDGSVQCETTGAGIVGSLSVERTGPMKIENCVNHADITCSQKSGGIVAEIMGGILHQEGELVISGCRNQGSILSNGSYSAGIITYLLFLGNEVDFRLAVENCTNEGPVRSTGYAGGILAFSNVGFNAETAAGSMTFSADTGVTLTNCTNQAPVTTTTSNSMAGGIVGVLGLGYIPTEISRCTNTGPVGVEFTLTPEEMEEQQGMEWIEFFQISGGIVGRIGDALKLTTGESNETSEKYVNVPNAEIVISDCTSTGAVSAPDYSSILNKWELPLYNNYLGGIIGQCSATDLYAFEVVNCTYSGAQRGLGDARYPDVGTAK